MRKGVAKERSKINHQKVKACWRIKRRYITCYWLKVVLSCRSFLNFFQMDNSSSNSLKENCVDFWCLKRFIEFTSRSFKSWSCQRFRRRSWFRETSSWRIQTRKTCWPRRRCYRSSSHVWLGWMGWRKHLNILKKSWRNQKEKRLKD